MKRYCSVNYISIELLVDIIELISKMKRIKVRGLFKSVKRRTNLTYVSRT